MCMLGSVNQGWFDLFIDHTKAQVDLFPIDKVFWFSVQLHNHGNSMILTFLCKVDRPGGKVGGGVKTPK